MNFRAHVSADSSLRFPRQPRMKSETELIIALSLMPIASETRNRVNRLLKAGINWSVVLRLVTEWRLEGTVFGNLRSHFSALVPPELHGELATLEKEFRSIAIARTLVLIDLVHELDRRGIPVLVLKGPATAITAYGDCSRRMFSDADLLVHRMDLGRARDTLLARRYSASFSASAEKSLISGQHALEFSNSLIAVELHWTLLSRHLRFDIDVNDLWSESVLVDCIGSRIRTLAPEHHFLYLCAHGAKHEWRLLRWVCDLAQLSRRLSPQQAQRAVAVAEAINARRLLSLGLRVVSEFYGDEDSPFPPSAFGSRSETARLVALVKARLASGADDSPNLLPRRIGAIHEYMEPLAFWLRARERLTDRIGTAAHFAFGPDPGDANQSQVKRVLRPIRLAANALRSFAHAS